MLFSAHTSHATANAVTPDTMIVDLRNITLTAGSRLVRTDEARKILLGGGFRPAVQTRDTGRIILGGGFRPAA